MDVRGPNKQLEKIKVLLVFFSFVAFFNCSHERALNFEVIYNLEKAEAIQFGPISAPDSLVIFRKDASTPVLGDLSKNETGHRFTPVLPFQSGAVYSIRYQGQSFEFTTKSSAGQAPEVLAIYPSTDTLPENLLKFYVKFSEPMQRIGSITDYIKIKKQGSDDYLDVFLPLETELWNEDHSQVTLWLDPGRIKKDLIPNKERGNPLEEGQHYELHIDSLLESAQGQGLGSAFVKNFYVGERDVKKPQISDWSIMTPQVNTRGELRIEFGESLDAILLAEAIEIVDTKASSVAGTFQLGVREESMSFKPLSSWKKGIYKIKIKAILEDLAANNLNRLFDEDLQKSPSNLKQAPYFYLDFEIE